MLMLRGSTLDSISRAFFGKVRSLQDRDVRQISESHPTFSRVMLVHLPRRHKHRSFLVESMLIYSLLSVVMALLSAIAHLVDTAFNNLKLFEHLSVKVST